MPSVVFDASSLVGALLKEGSVPERALLLARASATICLSAAVEGEIQEVFARPKFRKYLALTPGRARHVLAVLTVAARRVEPAERGTDCRDVKDNNDLELARGARAETIIASDDDLLMLHPWRGIEIVTPAQYVARLASIPGRGA